MGQPAARVTDMHVCPMVTGVVPHVGGPILPPCAITVLTCKLPQARVTDLCVCVGPPDMIIPPCAPTVLVMKLPAARMGDMTAHGGVIVLGCFTVLIGGAAPGGGPGAGGPPIGNPSGKGGSTTVHVDEFQQVVTIVTNMEFTGPGATQEYADAAKKQIEETWSGTMMRDGKEYKVNVVVNTKVNPTGPPTPGYDPINVDPANARMSQTLYGAGPGYQTPAAANDAARPRRIAHEYGHTLGLDDGYEDGPNGAPVKKDPTKMNDIMSETWPDASGTLPHPHQDQYDQILKNYGH